MNRAYHIDNICQKYVLGGFSKGSFFYFLKNFRERTFMTLKFPECYQIKYFAGTNFRKFL